MKWKAQSFTVYDAYFINFCKSPLLEAEFLEYVLSNWKDHKKTRNLIETFTDTTYWGWVTSIPSANAESATNEFFQKILRNFNNRNVCPTLESL